MPADGSGSDRRDPGDGDDSSDRPWNDAGAGDPDGERDRDRGDGRPPGPGPGSDAEHPLSTDETAAAIGHRYGRLWNGVDGLLVVGFGAVVYLGFRTVGLPAAAGLVVAGYLAYAYLPTLKSSGTLVLRSGRPPGAVREEFLDHRSPLVAVDATVAERIETTDDGATAIVREGSAGERVVYDADAGPARGVDFETRGGGRTFSRGRVRVAPLDGGSRVAVDFERVARFRLGELLHLPVLGRYQRRLWRHLGYEVVRNDVSLELR